MKTLEECVVTAMDGDDRDLFPFLPCILQDVWEIGSDPDVIVTLPGRYLANVPTLTILDPGCGKGAVSIRVAQRPGCTCRGIDAIPEFTDYIRRQEIENDVLENRVVVSTMVVRKKRS